jgi:hypothetical protein
MDDESDAYKLCNPLDIGGDPDFGGDEEKDEEDNLEDEDA